MRQIIWKEWQQQKWLFFLFCGAGIAFPLFEVLMVWRRNGNFHSDVGSGVVLGFGGLFTILLAIATTHCDTKKGVDDFLLSKPIRVYKLFVTKMVLAGVLLLIAFLFVSSLDFVSGGKRSSVASFAWTAICYTYPIALMLFAFTMFLVIILRDTAKAVLMAIWVALLVYFLPLLVGSLEWINIFEQLDNAYNRPSIIQYLVWRISLPENFETLGMVKRPAGIPAWYYPMPWPLVLCKIVSFPEYLQYLLFVAVTTIASVTGVVLSVKAMKNSWRWQPGQKTIVWSIGLSAAFIFGVAMTQVGHNLEPMTEHDGKPLDRNATFDWKYMPKSLHEGFPEGRFVKNNYSNFQQRSDAVCIQDDLMFRLSWGREGMIGQKTRRWEDEVVRHLVLQIYWFPYKANITGHEEAAKHYSFVVGAVRLAETEPVANNWTQYVLGCFVRGDRLYAAYRSVHVKDKEKYRFAESNPIHFVTIDISSPEEPKAISDIEISPPERNGQAIAIHNEYCYIHDGSDLIIISMSDPDGTKVVETFAFDELREGFEIAEYRQHGIWYVPSRWLWVAQGKLYCADGGRIVIFDLSNPLMPKPVFDYRFDDGRLRQYGQIEAMVYEDGFLYASSKNGVYVWTLMATETGGYALDLVGQRRATPIEKLVGRHPRELLLHNGYLVEASWDFGVLVYDVSNPVRPKRVFHSQSSRFVSDIGVWKGLLYAQGQGYELVFLDIPDVKQSLH